MIGIIGATTLLNAARPELEKKVIHTPYGNSEVFCGDYALLLRHHWNRMPHRINYRSHLAALATIGVSRIITIGSAGSLIQEIHPGSLVIPNDYISMTTIPSIHDVSIQHVSAGFSTDLTRQLAEIIPEAEFGGVYIQTRGPRIETRAEVRALAKTADIVGMTIASEATLAIELGMKVAALCTIDNYANGLTDEALIYENILASAKEHKERTAEIIRRIIRRFA
ncbi:MAG: MTAP family purine nucleoside phosphorylase [Methanoregulaceae archaeon]|nr:MTAP family purine nucleoside phosphorylase [Methanoregulaceae archaeon]